MESKKVRAKQSWRLHIVSLINFVVEQASNLSGGTQGADAAKHKKLKEKVMQPCRLSTHHDPLTA
jgi:hypothetical protein